MNSNLNLQRIFALCLTLLLGPASFAEGYSHAHVTQAYTPMFQPSLGEAAYDTELLFGQGSGALVTVLNTADYFELRSSGLTRRAAYMGSRGSLLEFGSEGAKVFWIESAQWGKKALALVSKSGSLTGTTVRLGGQATAAAALGAAVGGVLVGAFAVAGVADGLTISHLACTVGENRCQEIGEALGGKVYELTHPLESQPLTANNRTRASLLSGSPDLDQLVNGAE